MPHRLSIPSPRKRLGQHFLIDHNIVKKTIRLANIHPQEPVLEIGPGTGILTQALCQHAQAVTAIEIDSRMIEYLQQTLGNHPNLDLQQGDALDFPYHTLPKGTVVVANLPYYISTPLLFKLLESCGRIHRIIVMVQTEVANRIIAKPGTRNYGILSVLVQYWADATKAFSVRASCFRPKPGVETSVVKLVTHSIQQGKKEENVLFVKTVRAAFAHRRKTLRNSLQDAGFQPGSIIQAMEQIGLDHRCRAETLSLKDFLLLSESLQECGEST